MDRPALTAKSGATGSRSRPGSARAGRACRKPCPAVLRALVRACRSAGQRPPVHCWRYGTGR